MSDYTQITDFSAKDALTTGDPEKIILGADFDGEFAAIETAVATKYDSTDIASSAQATAGLLDTVLMTPLQVENVLSQNAGMVMDLIDMASPGADRILFWDQSAAAVGNLQVSTGLDLTGTALTLSHLGIENLVDPNADRIAFWDDSAGAVAWLTVGNGLDLTTTTLSLPSSVAGAGLAYSSGVLSVTGGTGITISGDAVNLDDMAGSSSNPVSITSGALAFSLSAITTIDIATIDQSQDGVLISDNGTLKVMDWNDGGVQVETFAADDTQDDTMYGIFRLLTGTTDRTFTFTSTATAPNVGSVILLGTRDTASLNLAVGGSATLTSTVEQGGSTTRVIPPGGTAMAVHVGSDEWMLVGDIT